jgi:hypothetical protein
MRVRVRQDLSVAEYPELTPGNKYHVIGIGPHLAAVVSSATAGQYY